MLEDIFRLAYPLQALLATLVTWGITALGASVVFFIRKPNRNFMDAMLGLAGGVMVAASFWSLLSPSIEMSGELGLNPWLTALAGFLGGGVLLFLGDRFFTRLQARRALLAQIGPNEDPKGRKRSALLLFSIGLQNLPEGMAVSVPLRREGYTRQKAFFYGQISGIAEPIAGFLGALLVLKVHTCLPFLLAFAAGAMIYVVVEELIPESQTNENKDWMALFTLVGFSIMMVLDVALG